MNRIAAWFKDPLGKRLARLHRWNAWIVLLLAVTGVLLSIGAIRGQLGATRLWIKQIHIAAGLVSILLVAVYLPLIRKHIRQIRGKRDRQWNLGIVLGLLAGWMVSGLVLWQFRRLPPSWSNFALFIHDALTWFGIPYAVYHSITRMRWMKRTQNSISPAKALQPMANKPFYTRREFLRWSIGGGLALLFGPFFFRWLTKVFQPGSASLDSLLINDANRMLPHPVPLPESVSVIGGGSKGHFRVYTVTPIPSFSSDTWTFSIKGLVERPQEWNWEQFMKLQRKVQVSDFHCVTGWSVYENTWEGIPLSAFLDIAGVKPGAKTVKFYSGDGVYTDSLSLEQARLNDVMVAVLHDGKPIPNQLGGPVRLIVPQMYAYKSVKWLNAIELIDKEHIGYWEARGYDTDAWVKSKG